MKALSRIYNFLVFAFLYAPIVVMVVYSFNGIKSRSVFSGFSLQWYEALFEDSVIMNSLYTSLILAVLSALIATAIGTVAAIGINASKGLRKRIYLAVNSIPMVNPEIVTAVSMMILFVFVINRFNSLEMGFGTLLISHITFCIPYVILEVMPKIKGMDSNIFNAALDLGCPPVKAFFKVVIPQIKPGIITGLIMAFTLSLDDFIISYFNSGSTVQTLSVTIFSMTKKPYSPKINALSTLLFTAILILLLVINIGQNKDSAKKKGAKK